MTIELSLSSRKIKNYLRRAKNQMNMRRKVMCLYYANIDGYPINRKLTIDEYNQELKNYPDYFKEKTIEEILELYNFHVNTKKPIKIIPIIDYDIKEYEEPLEISNKTLRPLYNDDWREKAEKMNGIEIEKQQSFYVEYLRYYLRFKRFPNFNEFLKYLYEKYDKPIHKDIRNVYLNIQKSYSKIDIDKSNFEKNKELIIKSANISNRKEMEKY